MGVVIMGHSFQSSISTWSGKLLQFNLQMYTHPTIVESGQWRLTALFCHWGMLEVPVYLYDKIKDSSTSLRFELLQRMGVKPVTSKAYTSKPVSDGLALWLLASHRGFLLQRLELFDFPYFPRVFQRIYVMVCPCRKHLRVSPGSLPIQLWCWTPYALRVRCLPSWRERKRKKEMNDAMTISSWRFVDSVNPHVTTPWGGMDCSGQPIWL